MSLDWDNLETGKSIHTKDATKRKYSFDEQTGERYYDGKR